MAPLTASPFVLRAGGATVEDGRMGGPSSHPLVRGNIAGREPSQAVIRDHSLLGAADRPRGGAGQRQAGLGPQAGRPIGQTGRLGHLAKWAGRLLPFNSGFVAAKPISLESLPFSHFLDFGGWARDLARPTGPLGPSGLA